MGSRYSILPDTTKLFFEGAFYVHRIFAVNPFCLIIVPNLKKLAIKMIREEKLDHFLVVDDYGEVGIKITDETSNVICSLYRSINEMLSTVDDKMKNKNIREISYEKTYIMHDPITNLYKIGKSRNPKFREKTLCSQTPQIFLFAVCNYNIEKELHKKYAHKRVRGEWFKLNNDDLKKIISYGFEII